MMTKSTGTWPLIPQRTLACKSSYVSGENFCLGGCRAFLTIKKTIIISKNGDYNKQKWRLLIASFANNETGN